MSQTFRRLSDKPGGPRLTEKQGHLRPPRTLSSVGGFTAHLQGGLGGWMARWPFPSSELIRQHTEDISALICIYKSYPRIDFFQNLQLQFSSLLIFFSALKDKRTLQDPGPHYSVVED